MSKSMVVSKKITVAKYLDKLSLTEHLVLLRKLTELIIEEEENNGRHPNRGRTNRNTRG